MPWERIFGLYHGGGLVLRCVPGEDKLHFPFTFKPVTEKWVLLWLLCQAPSVLGSVLGLVGPVLLYCD